MAERDIVRRTFTLTQVEDELLEMIAKRRHPTDFRVESQTIRELIREEAERIKQEDKKRGK